MAKEPMGDVVVLLPGILGSVLERDGKEIWAPSPGAIGRALWTLGRSVRSLALADDPWERDDLGDGVVATRVMPDVHIIPGLWGIDGYTAISRLICDHFDVVPGATYVEFPYDWRRDNRVAARRLQRVVDEKLHAQRQHNANSKVILIGHSMGGLVARYYLECLDGWRDTRMLITFGTPHRGSLNALDFLVNGFVKKVGPLKVADLTGLLRSLTSVYQLLPIYPCVDLGDGNQRVAETGDRLPGVDPWQAGRALHDFHRAISAKTSDHDRAAYAIHSVLGLAQGTKQSARWDGSRLTIDESYDGEDLGGDGTVPRVSATPVETDEWEPAYQPMYSADRHASLQNADAVQTQLRGILTARPLTDFRAVQSVRLEAEELLAAGESLAIRALPDRGNLTLQASLTDLATGLPATAPITMRRDSDDVHWAEFAPPPPGDYRLHVEAVGDSVGLADPVHGLVCVLDDVAPDVDPADAARP
jgi:pimeloyl-ACP methyl ester carboxylesterase